MSKEEKREGEDKEGWIEGRGTAAGGKLSIDASCGHVRREKNRYREEMVERMRKAGEPQCFQQR